MLRDYPLLYFVGQRDHPFYLTAGRQIEALRNLEPEPGLRIHPETAHRYGINGGDWVYLETTVGKIKLRAELDPAAHPDVVCAPHGWWFPERAQGEPGLSGLWESNSALVIGDNDEHCDPAQGLPQLRGMLCRVWGMGAATTLESSQGHALEVDPPGPDSNQMEPPTLQH